MNWKVKFFLLFMFFSCGTVDDNNSDVVVKPHYNIVIVPDLSNRLDQELYPRQLNDDAVFKVLLKLVPTLVKDFNRQIMQKDKISLRLLNPRDVTNFNSLQSDLTIDLGVFDVEHKKRSNYLANKSEQNLEKDISNFLKASTALYKESKSKGYTADLWGFFNQSLNENFFKLTNSVNTEFARDSSINILILITDGYVDLVNQKKEDCPDKVCKWLNHFQIKAFRDFYKKTEDPKNSKDVFKKSGYGLSPVNNKSLANVKILMLEVYDRSKSPSGMIREIPSDFEILQLFWSDFFEKSGVKQFKIVETCSSEAELEAVINSFVRGK